MGVELKFDTPLRVDFGLTELREMGFEAIFLSIGTQRGRDLKVEGSELDGVVKAGRLPLECKSRISRSSWAARGCDWRWLGCLRCRAEIGIANGAGRRAESARRRRCAGVCSRCCPCGHPCRCCGRAHGELGIICRDSVCAQLKVGKSSMRLVEKASYSSHSEARSGLWGKMAGSARSNWLSRENVRRRGTLQSSIRPFHRRAARSRNGDSSHRPAGGPDVPGASRRCAADSAIHHRG